MRLISSIVVGIVTTGILYVLIIAGYGIGMRQYCHNLRDQAIQEKENRVYYITKMDRDECLKDYKVEIDARVE